MAMVEGQRSPAPARHCLPPSLQMQKKAYLQAADHCHPRESPGPQVPSARPGSRHLHYGGIFHALDTFKLSPLSPRSM